MTTPRFTTGHRRALTATVLASILGAFSLVTAAPASAEPSDCTRWISGSRGQTINVVCKSGTGHYGVAARCANGKHAGGKVVAIGETTSAICRGSSVEANVLYFYR